MTSEEFYTFQPQSKIEIFHNQGGEISVRQTDPGAYDESIISLTLEQARWLVNRMPRLIDEVKERGLENAPEE